MQDLYPLQKEKKIKRQRKGLGTDYIEQLYDKATSAVQMNGSIGEWFRTTVGVRQGCLLSPTLFNIFHERIMSDALENMKGRLA